MTDNPKLKPCPFCGGEAKFSDDNTSYDPWWTAHCLEYHAQSPQYKTKKSAATWWNRRNKRKEQP